MNVSDIDKNRLIVLIKNSRKLSKEDISFKQLFNYTV